MDYTIRENLHLNLFGFSGIAQNKEWVKTGFALMDKMWARVKSAGLRNKGMNIWVYDFDNAMFAGVELDPPIENTGLEFKEIRLEKYAHCKHIGPYEKIPRTGVMVSEALKKNGIGTSLPYIEIYGHWTNDPSTLETELIWTMI